MQQYHERRVYNMNGLPTSVQTFIKNYNKPTIDDNAIHFNNIYHIISEDRDGNITDEKFGTNILTDRCLQWISDGGKFDGVNPTVLYIGTGTDPIDPSAYKMQSLVACQSAILHSEDDNINNTTNLIYDSNTGIVSCYSKKGTFQYDYNISGVDTDVTITEMGISNSANTSSYGLLTHTKVYNISGVETPFVKRINEKLTVTLYWGVAMNLPSVINSLWTSHNYTVINPLYFVTPLCQQYKFEPGNGIHVNVHHTLFDRSSHIPILRANQGSWHNPFYHGTVDTTTGTVTGNSIFNSGNSKLFESGWISKLITTNDGTYRVIVSYVDHDTSMKLASPESVEIATLSNFKDNTFSDALWSYGRTDGTTLTKNDYRGSMPVNQLTVSNMKIYDYLNHTWVDEDIDQDTTFIYDHSFVYGVYYKTTLNGDTVEVYVYPNSKAGSYDITSFITNSSHVWATDTYWDPSSWEAVTIANVEQSLQNKKFYIRDTGTKLIPVYDYTCLQLDNVNTGYVVSNTGIVINSATTAVVNRQMDIIPNPKCNCIIGFNKIIYPDDPSDIVTYDIYNYGNKSCDGYVGSVYYQYYAGSLSMFKITDDGDRLIMSQKCNSANNANDNYCCGCYRIYTISDDKTVAPTYVDVQIPYTSQTADTLTFHSFTDQGYVVASHNADNEIGIIDLYAGSGSEASVITGTWGMALNRTTYCVYRDVSDLSVIRFNVYDLSTSTVVKTFTIAGNYTINGITGWRNHVYVRVKNNDDNLYYISYHNITTDESAILTDPFDNTSGTTPLRLHSTGIWDNSFRSCDECLLIPAISSVDDTLTGSVQFRIVMYDDPTNFRNLSDDFGFTVSTNGRFSQNTDGSFVGLEILTTLNDYNGVTTDYTWNSVLQPYNSSSDRATHSYVLLDIGDLYDNNHIDKFRFYNVTKNHSYAIMHTAYKEYDIYPSSSTDLTFNPLRRSRIHKIIGTTNTIQTINNPKEILPNDILSFVIKRS